MSAVIIVIILISFGKKSFSMMLLVRLRDAIAEVLKEEQNTFRKGKRRVEIFILD